MRTETEIRDRIQMAIVEEINKCSEVFNEPENLVPRFIENLSNKITEITLDEITNRRRF